jgi:type IV secretory pathway TraG/TraD family ATPase VirD4
MLDRALSFTEILMTKPSTQGNQHTGKFWETVPSFIPPEQAALYKWAISPTGLSLIFCILLLLIISKPSSNKKGILANAYFANDGEISAAKTASLKMIKHPRRDAAALWIGLPPSYSTVLNRVGKLCCRTKTLYFNAQTGTLILGGAGTGKSFSAVMPMARSVLKQGFPMSFYDFKYPEAAEDIVSDALAAGYEVSVFAPGFPESATLNILDFLTDSSDGLAAKQVAKVIVKNVNGNSSNTGDNFFEPAGIQLVTDLLQAAKWVGEITNNPDNADLMTCSAILSLSNLAARIEYSFHRLDIWVANAFAQLISSHSGVGTNNTESGIVATAQKVFSAVIQAEFIPALCGKSDFKIDLRGKNLVVFGLNQKYRYAVSPFLAAAMDMILDRNLDHALKRKDPIANFLDELPSLYLERIVNYLAEARSAGNIGVIGGQSYFQFEKMFGKELTNVIFANCANKIVMNPQEYETAEMFSKILGDKDVRYKTSSITHSKADRSRQISENLTTTRLMPPERILQFPQGEGLVINPLFQRGRNAYLPLHHRFKIPKYEMVEVQRNKRQHWQRAIDYMRGGEKLSAEEAGRMLSERIRMVAELFPEPPANAVGIPIKVLVLIAQNYKLLCVLPSSLSLESIVKVAPEFVTDDDRVVVPNIRALQGLLQQFGIKYSGESLEEKMGKGKLQDFVTILSAGAFTVVPPIEWNTKNNDLHNLPIDANGQFRHDAMIDLLRKNGFNVAIATATLPSRVPSPKKS